MKFAGVARNKSERDQALQLAAQSFSLAGINHDVALLRKAFLLCEHPGYNNNSPIVICDADGSVVGSAFLIDCLLPLGGQLLKGVFISSVSVAESWRGQGVSVLLMDAAISAAKNRGIDIAIVIARRAVDGYYTRFGFWGVAQYSQVTLNLATLPDKPSLDKMINVRPAGLTDLEVCASLHTESYKNLAGHCLRKLEMWAYILNKLPYLGMRFDIVTFDGKTVGYVIHDGQGNLHEVATRTNGLACGARNFLKSYVSGDENLTLHISPTHPFLTQLAGSDISLTLREGSYGGHMVRILSPALIDSPAENLNTKNGHLNFAQTSRALGLSRLTDCDSALGNGVCSSFNIPLFDQI